MSSLPHTLHFEVHYDRGSGWQSLGRVIHGASEFATEAEALSMIDRVKSIAEVDPYYVGATYRVVAVERRVVRVLVAEERAR